MGTVTKYVNELDEVTFLKYLFQFLKEAIRRKIDLQNVIRIAQQSEDSSKIGQN